MAEIVPDGRVFILEVGPQMEGRNVFSQFPCLLPRLQFRVPNREDKLDHQEAIDKVESARVAKL
jgi:hypothetical protein